jgi:enoyl-CoA hydratase
MAFEYLQVERDGGVVHCTFVNPPMNFMNGRMVAELDVLTREVAASQDDRVLMFTGGVDGIFITHYDVSELSRAADSGASGSYDGGRETAGQSAIDFIHTVFNGIQSLPKVTIAALNGTAMGGGCELSLACDLRVMADGPYRIGLPETSVGIIPGAGGTQRLARLLGKAKALDLILHGRVVEPQEALALGLVHRLFPVDSFRASAAAFARELAGRAPIALAAAKRAIHAGLDTDLESGLAIEREEFAKTMNSADARGAMRAYLKGEPYTFKGE